MLTCKNQELDLGTLKFGVPHTFKYELRNESSTPATIDKLTLGCHACTQAVVDRTEVGGNETTTVTATFTPGSTGINNKYIIVQYNTASSIKLKFKASVNQ